MLTLSIGEDRLLLKTAVSRPTHPLAMTKRFKQHFQAPKYPVIAARIKVNALGLKLLGPWCLKIYRVVVGQQELNLEQEGLYDLVVLLCTASVLHIRKLANEALL